MSGTFIVMQKPGRESKYGFVTYWELTVVELSPAHVARCKLLGHPLEPKQIRRGKVIKTIIKTWRRGLHGSCYTVARGEAERLCRELNAGEKGILAADSGLWL